MATIKELEANREKLRKYDELKEWKERFGLVALSITQRGYSVDGVEYGCLYELPDNIKTIIVNALQAEIEKLDEE